MLTLAPVDYSCEDCCCLVSVSCETMSNPNSLHISETGSLKKNCHLDEDDVRKPLVDSISQNSGKLRLLNLAYYLTISNPSLKMSIFKGFSWPNRSFKGGGGDDRVFERVSQTYSMTPTSPVNLPTSILSSHL